MKIVKKKFPEALYIILSSVAFLIWLCLLFFALLLGGSYGPDHQRSVPLIYAAIIALGLLGAMLGIAAGRKGLGVRMVRKSLPIFAASLGMIGSLPFFLLDLAAIGLLSLLTGVLPTILYLLLRERNKSIEK